MLYRNGGTGGFKQIDKVNLKNEGNLNVPFIFLPDGNRGLVMRDNDAGKTGIVEMDLATQEVVSTVYQPDIGEVRSAKVSYDESTLLGVNNTDLKTAVHWFDSGMATIQTKLDKLVNGAKVTIESYNPGRMTAFLSDAFCDRIPVSIFYRSRPHDRSTPPIRPPARNRKLGEGRCA
jgi:protease II